MTTRSEITTGLSRLPAPLRILVQAITGLMGCVACVDAVSRAVRGVDGVVDASVTVGAATVSVTEANDAMAAAISDAVRRAGFPPGIVRWNKI